LSVKKKQKRNNINENEDNLNECTKDDGKEETSKDILRVRSWMMSSHREAKADFSTKRNRILSKEKMTARNCLGSLNNEK